MPTPASNPTNTISEVLRGLGLRQRAHGDGARDFTVEGTYEGDRCTSTYVVALTPGAEETITRSADEIAAKTAATPYPFTLAPVTGPDGTTATRLVCTVATERKKMKPRTTPKRYDAGTGAPASEDLPEGKVARLINVLGPVWAGAKDQAKNDGLSVSHVAQQLLAAYGSSEFQFDANGTLIPPRPTTDHARAVLLEALNDHFANTSTGMDVNPDAVAEALATALQNAGYARTK